MAICTVFDINETLIEDQLETSPADLNTELADHIGIGRILYK